MSKSLNTAFLSKAIDTLELAVTQCEMYASENNLRPFIRDSVIQRFEFTFKLVWKLLKRFLESQMLEQVDGLIASDLFRLSFESGLVSDPVLWMGFRKSRNLTSHTYDESTGIKTAISNPLKKLKEN